MDVTPSQSGYDKLERFLDDVDQVRDPGSLEEPFRTLWLRVHGLDPSSIEKLSASEGGPVQDLIPSTIEITPSAGLDASTLERTGKVKRIEVLSPQEVGPTFEMKMDEKKLTFKMAGVKDIRSSNLKRDAGNLMVGLQSKLVPLTGLGGDVPALQDMMRQVASSYKEADFEKAVSICGDIGARLGSEDLKKDILIKVQKRMSDYQQLGADQTKAREEFKALASSLRENRDDFYTILTGLIKGLEDSVKGLGIEEVSAEVVEVAEEVVEPAPKTEVPREGPLAPKEEQIQAEPPKTPPKPSGPDEKREDLKPVVKFVKKKLTLVPEGNAPVTDVAAGPKAIVAKPPEPMKTPSPSAETPPPDIKQEERTPQAAADDGERAARQKEATDAFNRIQIVHKAATALHKKGKDVGQIFDLLRYAEEARKKNELKAYIGVSKQLESMLLAMQSKK
ncbi:MAG: hypothetical protein MUC62_06940 [Candidatus Thermoplasmatota archaeon]|jgi:hypothetical protein|nr:hypothetical protein [Candidatus Thermoplasmatota archaeon]